MVVTLFAKIVADAFDKLSIYDLVIKTNGLPYLEESSDLGDLQPAEIADAHAPVILVDDAHTIGSLQSLLARNEGRVAGFPVLRHSPDGKRIVGYIAVQDLGAYTHFWLPGQSLTRVR
jgi:hypothetical protein